jgi:hypothetical protein
MSSDRQACDIYTRSLVDCLRNDLTGLIYHKLLSTVIQKNRKKTDKKIFTNHSITKRKKNPLKF